MRNVLARNRRITFERSVATRGAYNEKTEAWSPIGETFAEVRFGAGRERREAAQESAVQAATFRVLWSPTLAGVLMTDRITFDGVPWDITNKAEIGLHEAIEFTAVRKA